MSNHCFVSFFVIACVAAGCLESRAQSKVGTPKNAREVQLMRAYYDKTVWSKEVMAQRYERSFTDLWDALIQQPDKFQVLASVSFDQIELGSDPKSETLDWGIERTSFNGTNTVSREAWPKLIDAYKQQGYKIVETEWHHSEFVPPTDSTPARSIVSAVIYATKIDPKNTSVLTKYVLKGDLHVEWQPGPDPNTKRFLPKTVNATRMTLLRRTGGDVFEYKKSEAYAQDPSGKSSAPVTIHPIILQDLNGDGLPEVSIVGANKVLWNKGSWEFDEDPLVKFPTKNVNAATFGDFNGDGVLDLLCAPKNGMPTLHVGEEGGKFETPPQVLNIAVKKLRNPVGLTAGDIDKDGDLDVFMGQNRVGYQTGDIPTPYYDAKDSFPSYLLINDGKGNFRDVTAISGLSGKSTRRNFSSSFVDLDNDNDLDLLLTNDFHGNDLFLNDGTGTFTDATESLTPTSLGHGMSHSFGDYNLDGRLDFIFVAMSSTTARRLDKLQLGPTAFPKQNDSRKHMGYGNRMYLSGEGGLKQAPFNADVARTGWSWGSTTFDFDRDGDPDIYIANGQTSGKTTQDYCTRYWCHDLYYPAQNLPRPVVSEYFKRLTPVFSGRSVSWNGYEHNALLMNQDGKGFINVGFLMNCGSVLDSRSTVSGDIDLDGKVDVLFEHLDAISGAATLHFLKNNWQDDHHWMGFHLPESAYGSKVKVVLPDSRILVQHYLTGHSVWVQHPSTIHFGIGKHTAVKSAEIIWPDGTATQVDAKTDQYISVSR